MKKTNKFLLLALILIGATNQVSLCMQKEEVIEIEEREQEKVVKEVEKVIEKQSGSLNIVTKEENDKLKELSLEKEDQAEERTKKLGNLSVLPNEILFIICEFVDPESLIKLSKNSILREIIFNHPTIKDIVKIFEKMGNIQKNLINGPKLIILYGQNSKLTYETALNLSNSGIFIVNGGIECTGIYFQSCFLAAKDVLLKTLENEKKTMKNERIRAIYINDCKKLFRKEVQSDDLRHFGNIIDQELINSMKEILHNNRFNNIILYLTTKDINDIPNEIQSEASLIKKIYPELHKKFDEITSSWFEQRYPKKSEQKQNKGIISFLKSLICCGVNRE